MKISSNSAEEIRSVAELIMNESQAQMMGFNSSRTHSINLITEDFLGGYMQDGRMSVVRRFFCLFVTFDLVFVSLLWLICIMVNGDNIFQALQKEIVHYTIYTSLFDVVAAAFCRFVVLIIFYAFLYINHWYIIALTTSSSCLFLISKVFVFDWLNSTQKMFEVILIVTSFVLAWGEAWFLDCRVIPQERHARRYFSSSSQQQSSFLAPLLIAPTQRRPPESAASFYSPLDSAHNSDDEEELDNEYLQMGLECVNKAYEILQSTDWKVEKIAKSGDTIYSINREKLGKIYKLTGRVKCAPKLLCLELFNRIEDQPCWNPTLIESKIVRKINSYTDITYQATVGGGGGIIKNRDFVNLRCWRTFINGKICDNNLDTDLNSADTTQDISREEESGLTFTDGNQTQLLLPSSANSDIQTNSMSFQTLSRTEHTTNAFLTLSRSLGAKDFRDSDVSKKFNEPPSIDDVFVDAKSILDEGNKNENNDMNSKIWINAAVGIDYDKVPVTTKYTRGQNMVASFAMHEIRGKPDSCIFEWILCLDLKGYVPRYILDSAYTSFMLEYMTYLRKRVQELYPRKHLLSNH